MHRRISTIWAVKISNWQNTASRGFYQRFLLWAKISIKCTCSVSMPRQWRIEEELLTGHGVGQSVSVWVERFRPHQIHQAIKTRSTENAPCRRSHIKALASGCHSCLSLQTKDEICYFPKILQTFYFRTAPIACAVALHFRSDQHWEGYHDSFSRVGREHERVSEMHQNAISSLFFWGVGVHIMQCRVKKRKTEKWDSQWNAHITCICFFLSLVFLFLSK